VSRCRIPCHHSTYRRASGAHRSRFGHAYARTGVARREALRCGSRSALFGEASLTDRAATICPTPHAVVCTFCEVAWATTQLIDPPCPALSCAGRRRMLMRSPTRSQEVAMFKILRCILGSLLLISGSCGVQGAAEDRVSETTAALEAARNPFGVAETFH